MDKKKYVILSTFLLSRIIFSQVIIGDEKYENNNSILSVINKQDNKENSKGIKFPVIKDKTSLPLYNLNNPAFFDSDPSMEGMVVYQDDIGKFVLYNGDKWIPTLFEEGNRMTRVSMDDTILENDYPKIGCFLIGCGSEDVPFNVKNDDIDSDELKIVNKNGIINKDDFSNFTFKESGLYRVIVSLGVKTSGLHITPPIISIRAIKNNFVLSRKDIPLNEAILITAGANRSGSMEFIGMFDKNDLLKIQISSAIGILTVADVYQVRPSNSTYVSIEKLF